MGNTVKVPITMARPVIGCPKCSEPGSFGITSILGQTTIQLDVTNSVDLLIAGIRDLHVYAIDPAGNLTRLGRINLLDQRSSRTLTTSLKEFQLVVSQDPNLTSIGNNRPALGVSRGRNNSLTLYRLGRARFEEFASDKTSETSSPYSAKMLGVPTMKRGEEMLVNVTLSGSLSGSRVSLKVQPFTDGSTLVTARFQELKDPPIGKVYVLWAVSPDNKYIKLGQIVKRGNEAAIQSATRLPDFGLLLTSEDEPATPRGVVIGTVIR